MAKKNKLSIIVPCYNEEEVLVAFYDEIIHTIALLAQWDIEIWFIDDGSTDGTLNLLKDFADKDNRVNYCTFSRNFGKEAAIYAGLEKANGDYMVIMDADLQDPPYLLPKMLHFVEEGGYDSVATRRVSRMGEPLIRSFFARLFYRLMNCISRTELMDGARDYRIMSRQFVEAILSMGEYNRFSKGIFGWVGFRTKWIEYENVERAAGETKWSFWKLFAYAMEGIMAFSTMPLIISSLLGACSCLFSFLFAVFIIAKKLIFGDPVQGWATLAVLVLFLGGGTTALHWHI